MPTLDELRKRFGSKSTAPVVGTAAPAATVANIDIGQPVFGGVSWTAEMVKRWTAKFDIISKGTMPSGDIIVTDLRFKFGRSAGKTMRDMASATGGARGYLRWFYCETGMDECIKAVVQLVLGEDHDQIMAKYNKVEK